MYSPQLLYHLKVLLINFDKACSKPPQKPKKTLPEPHHTPQSSGFIGPSPPPSSLLVCPHSYPCCTAAHSGPNTAHHQSQHTGNLLHQRFKAHIWTWYPMAYIMMVVRLNWQSVPTTPNPHWIPICTHPSHNRYPAPQCREKYVAMP